MAISNQNKVKRSFWCLAFSFFILLAIVSSPPVPASAGDKVRVGVVFSADVPYYRDIHRYFVEALKEKGIYGKIDFLVQKPHPDPIAWSNALRKLYVYDASIIITYGPGTSETVKYEISDVPVFYAGLYSNDTVLKNSHFAGGVEYTLPVTSLLRYLRKMDSVKRIGIFFFPAERTSLEEAKKVRERCMALGLSPVMLPVHKSKEIGEKLRLFDLEGLYITGSSFVLWHFPEYISEVQRRKLSVVTSSGGLEDKAMLSLYSDPVLIGRDLSELLTGYMKKGKRGDFRVERRNKLVFNYAISKEMGIDIPLELLTEADEVIR